MSDQTGVPTQSAPVSAVSGRGGVLAYSKILARLQSGEIFVKGTWDESSIRAAAYDLRIADDFMIIAEGEGATPLVYDIGVKREGMIVLKPGQLALISTAENLRMPWDLAGQIGLKSSVARRGILMLGGGFVDPGFGLTHVGERLHFLLMNIGGRDVYLVPGKEKFASLQVGSLDGEVPQEIQNRQVRGMDDARRAHFQAAPGVEPGMDLALGFFTELSKLRADVRKAESKLTDLQSGILPLTTFGVTILGVVLLGVVLTSLMDLASKDTIVARVKILADAAGGGVGVLGLAVVTVGLAWLSGKLIDWLGRAIIGIWRHRTT